MKDLPFLSRDLLVAQRKWRSLLIERTHGLVDRPIELLGIGEGLMGEMMRLEVPPDAFDVIELWRILREPLDGEPMGTGGERCPGEFAGVDWTIVLDQNHRFDRLSGLGPVEPVQLFEMGDEVAAALGRTGVHDELARDVIERTHHRHLPGLSWRRNT